MLRTNICLTEEQDHKIKIRAVVTPKTKTEVLREIIDKGLQFTPIQKSASTEAFIRLGKISEMFQEKGTAPSDLSTRSIHLG